MEGRGGLCQRTQIAMRLEVIDGGSILTSTHACSGARHARCGSGPLTPTVNAHTAWHSMGTAAMAAGWHTAHMAHASRLPSLSVQGADAALVAGCCAAIESQETLASASKRLRTALMDAAVEQSQAATRAEGGRGRGAAQRCIMKRGEQASMRAACPTSGKRVCPSTARSDKVVVLAEAGQGWHVLACW